MHSLSSTSPGSAWKKAVELVLEKGSVIKDGEEELLELLNVSMKIEQPDVIDSIVKNFGDIKMIEWMDSNFLSKEAVPEWGYSYGQRLRDFMGVDQLERITQKLKRNPDTKSATASLAIPHQDQKHMPCITTIDFKLRNGELMGIVFIRSHDVGKKYYADVIAIGNILRKMANDLDVKKVSLVFHTASLHLYLRDRKEAEQLAKS